MFLHYESGNSVEKIFIKGETRIEKDFYIDCNFI